MKTKLIRLLTAASPFWRSSDFKRPSWRDEGKIGWHHDMAIRMTKFILIVLMTLTFPLKTIAQDIDKKIFEKQKLYNDRVANMFNECQEINLGKNIKAKNEINFLSCDLISIWYGAKIIDKGQIYSMIQRYKEIKNQGKLDIENESENLQRRLFYFRYLFFPEDFLKTHQNICKFMKRDLDITVHFIDSMINSYVCDTSGIAMAYFLTGNKNMALHMSRHGDYASDKIINKLIINYYNNIKYSDIVIDKITEIDPSLNFYVIRQQTGLIFFLQLKFNILKITCKTHSANERIIEKLKDDEKYYDNVLIFLHNIDYAITISGEIYCASRNN